VIPSVFPPSPLGFLAATGSSDGVTACVLLFVMKITFQKMDGEFLGEKHNLKEPMQRKNILLQLLASSFPDGGVTDLIVLFVCVSGIFVMFWHVA